MFTEIGNEIHFFGAVFSQIRMLGLPGNPGLGAWPAMPDRVRHTQARAPTTSQS